MQDIRRQDTRLFLKELAAPGRVVLTVLAVAVIIANVSTWTLSGFLLQVGLLAFVLAISAHGAYRASVNKRWRNPRFKALWNGCLDRLERFEKVLAQMRRDRVADLREMPRTIRIVGDNLYFALRRADLIAEEVHITESNMMSAPPIWTARTDDPQSKELYRIADRNIAEYRQQYAGVMAGVQRTEAQCAVFMTTVDTLRMKILGYRLVGRDPAMPSHDFIEALNEAKLQLQAIDQALDELELGPFPTTITVMPPGPSRDASTGPVAPPPIPDDIRMHLRQGDDDA
jgi:hypothetical protein